MTLTKHKIPYDIKELHEEVTADLLANKEVFDGNDNHNFSDVLQHVYDNVDDLQAMDKALHQIANGNLEIASAKIQRIIIRAAEELALDLCPSIQHHHLEQKQEAVADLYHM